MKKKSKKVKEEFGIVAWLTIRRADEMTKAGRKQVAAWLRREAQHLIADGEKYSKRFTSRYLYKKK